jgi:hypothetical protein
MRKRNSESGQISKIENSMYRLRMRFVWQGAKIK